jgi:hypothetical protein
MTWFAPFAAALTIAAASSALAQDPMTTQGVRQASAVTIIDAEHSARFRAFVTGENRPSAALADELRVGAVLPEKTVVFYAVPADYGARGYRYAVVNNRTVLVHPATHQVVEIIK